MSPCPHCATELEDGARFCGSCGKKIDVPAPLPAASPADTTLGPPARRADVSGTIRPLNRQPRVEPKATAPAGAAGLESAAMTIFQSAKVAGGGPAPATAPPAAAPVLAATPAPAPANVAVRPAAQAAENLIGRTLNHRYLVEDKIGEGGFGAVFRGKQIATGREVALKILHPHNSADQTIVARFRREAEACSKLRDPHTVTTYDFDETEDGILFLAMELLRGRSLHQLQKTDGVLPPERVLVILDQVAQSLGEAHANGIVHRDMKPENVFIETRVGTAPGSHVKVLDFGIAKMMSGDEGGPGPHGGGADAGHAGVHVARAAARAEARRAVRHLRARHDGLRDADRRAAVQERQEPDRDHQLSHEGAAPAALEAQGELEDSGGRRRHHRQDGRQEPRRPLRRHPSAARGHRQGPEGHGPQRRQDRGLSPRRRDRRAILVVGILVFVLTR